MWYRYGYGYGWWWWWIVFVIIFFLLPLGYGWGYRGWGPWYRRRPRSTRTLASDTDPVGPVDTGWGWLGIALWIILLIAIIWALGAWGWGTW
ncbi:MAG TPA: hypothetical protein VN730_09090 [Steroidobacteraceae bacterium]|nr:hypothetical protein [Steroidobacteraceae bacterium]